MDALEENDIKSEIKEEPLDEFPREDGNDLPHTVHSNEDPFQIEIKLEELTSSFSDQHGKAVQSDLGCFISKEPNTSDSDFEHRTEFLDLECSENVNELINFDRFITNTINTTLQEKAQQISDSNGQIDASNFNPMLYECSECSKTFSSEIIFKAHKEMHAGLRPFSCNICDMSFKKKGKLKEHKDLHKGYRKYKCDICQKKFVRKDYLQKHLSTHTGNSFDCLKCGKCYRQKYNLKRHMPSCPGIFKCGGCGESFTSMEIFRSHTYECEKNSYIRKRNQERKLAAGFPKKFPIKKKSLAFNKFQCDERGNKFKLKVTHERHKRIECYVCKKAFCKRDNLEKHLTSHDQAKIYECFICKIFFADKSIFEEHKLECEKNFFQTNIQQLNLQEKALLNHQQAFKCLICKRLFPDKSILEEHKLACEKHNFQRAFEKIARHYGLKDTLDISKSS